MSDLFLVHSKAIPSSARVVAFKGVEALSSPYAVEVDVLIPDSTDIDLEGAVGERARLVATRGDGMTFNGAIASIELLNLYRGNGVYRLTLRPKLWQLTLSEHSRVFVDKAVPEILEDVLTASGLTSGADYELRLEAPYAKLDHVCQYRESSFAFISRWMEREGIYYFFEQGEEEERLVLSDAKGGHPEAVAGPVKFLGLHGADVTAPEGLQTFTCKHNQLPGRVSLTDYDYIKPGLALEGVASVAAGGPDAIVRYGDNFDSPGEGARLAKIRAEELRVRREVFRASGTQLGFHAGSSFALDEHPRQQFNQRYLLTAVEHFGNQSGGSAELARILELEHAEVYRVEVQAIRADRQFRAASATAIPRISSVQNAIIDGESESQYAQIDAHGRYKVKVKFDEGDAKGGKASMWVRMLQPHGGGTEGFHFPLRAGTEVLLIFLGGDPDRPIIAGVGPNTAKPSPVTLSNFSKNVIQTGGLNRFEMEDMAGAQYTNISTPTEGTFLHMGAPRDGAHLVQCTGGDNLVKIGGDRTIRVQGDRLEHVVGDLIERVLGDKAVEIEGDVEKKYLATLKHTVDADVEHYFNSNEFKKTLGDQTEEITGNVLKTIEGTGTHEYTGEYELTVHADAKKHVDGTLKIESDGKMTIESTASEIEMSASTQITIKAPEVHTETGFYFEKKTTDNTFVLGEKMEIVAGALLDVKAGGVVDVTVGLMLEMFAGARLSTTTGFALELEPLLFKTHAMKLEEAAMECLTSAITNRTAAITHNTSALSDEECALKCLEAALTNIV